MRATHRLLAVALLAALGACNRTASPPSADVATVSGRYFVKERPVESSPQSRDASAALRLWRLSAEMTGLKAG